MMNIRPHIWLFCFFSIWIFLLLLHIPLIFFFPLLYVSLSIFIWWWDKLPPGTSSILPRLFSITPVGLMLHRLLSWLFISNVIYFSKKNHIIAIVSALFWRSTWVKFHLTLTLPHADLSKTCWFSLFVSHCLHFLFV